MAKYTDPEASVHSAKVEALLSLVQGAFALGEKTLVFSKFVLVLDFLAAKLDEHNIVYRALTGRLNAEKRDEAIRSFNSDPSIALFLISTTAGSTGINLTAASRVIIFDNGWNPVHEEQAIGRAYRMGQTRPVHVYRFIAEDTVEEGLFKAQVQKQLLARQALDAENLKS
ncbi:P-loop containing nucleoside triphosphate hydrolase protein, partial [Blastocladiella britannica]